MCSGSDDFGVYIWKCPSERNQKWNREAHLNLRGHRSIVNQVRYNSKFHLLISSGVEKIVKVWSPYPTPNSLGGLLGRQDEYLPERKLFTNRELFALNWSNPFQSLVSSDINNNITSRAEDEDQMILAFFDSLVRKEMLTLIDDENERERIVGLADESSDDDLEQAGDEYFDEEEDEEESRPSRRSASESLVQFESDNEPESNDNEWSSSSESLTSDSPVSRRTFTLRSLKQRHNENLANGTGFLSVIDALNSAPGEQKSDSGVETSHLISRERDGHFRDCGIDNEQVSMPDVSRTSSEGLRVVKSLNEHRRIIELNEDVLNDTRIVGDGDGDSIKARNNSDIMFRRSREYSEGNTAKKYRSQSNIDKNGESSGDDGEDKNGSSPKRIKL